MRFDTQLVKGGNPCLVENYVGCQRPVSRTSMTFFNLCAHVDAAARVKREVLVDMLLTILIGKHLLLLVGGERILPNLDL